MKKYLDEISLIVFLGVAILAWVHFNAPNSATYINPLVAHAPPSAGQSAQLSPLPAPAGAAAQNPPSAVATVAPSQPSPITAEAYLVANADTGQIYASKNTQMASPIASISKLFVALVANADMDPNQVIAITQPMLDVYPDSYGFTLGEKFTLSELMYPLLIESNNNIAEGIAMTYGYTSFIQKMNALAASLGLKRTHFQDASGLSDGNISDAQDLFAFGRYLYASQRPLLALTTTGSWTFATTSDHGSHIITSTDPFIGDPSLIGGKTGRTDAAGETMLTIFNYMHNGKSYPIVIVVLHSDLGERQNDSSRLLLQAIAMINSKG
jgi:D-alanyl-D-alanine carboxypeptidase (penicillin-binding protein 5/6)